MTEQQAPTMDDVQNFQRQVIAEFRANRGKVGGMFEGARLVLLTTVGARSSRRRTNPLAYLEIDGQPTVIASAAGAPHHPAWFHNIRKNPMVTVETGTETYEAIAAVPPAEERDRLFAKVLEAEPGFGDYQEKTTRLLPVVVLHRIEPVPGADRVKGLGDELVEIHDWLRQELVELRQQVDEVVDGAESAEVRRPTPDLARELRTHCLSFCEALKVHHNGEDAGGFPVLAKWFPGLAPTLAELTEEHKKVARLHDEIQRLVDGYTPGVSDPHELRNRLEDLATELEAHFEWEEQTVVAALNAMGPAPERR